ncbi:MAG: isopeptide-forming domain-containing fimbrial protein [Ruminococcaceae bacterium]|nr:isopeptide-forming domain-containing fimbrial protein [Oscillospiraceae bacterium]
MKQTKKLFSIVLAIALVFAMAIPAFAGTGTIEIKNAVKDHTYAAYKMLNFTPVAGETDKGVYTIAEDWEDFFTTGAGKDYFDISADGKVTLKADKTVDADLAKAAVAYAKDEANGITAAASETATGNTVTLSGLDLGYYAVDTSVGTICSLTNTSTTAKAIEKNSAPELTKKIVEGEGRVDTNTVKIGDIVTYEAKITVGAGAENYVMHDKMSDGLDFQKVVSVKVVDATATAGTDYVVKEADLEDTDCDFEIEFKNSYINTLKVGDVIVVTYEAKLTGDKVVIGADGNPNEAWLDYGEESSVSTTPDKVITYTTKLTVNKTDEDDQPLAGAGFTLYKKNAEDVYEEYAAEIKDVTTFEWKGLDEGDYKIVESTVPAGYNKAADIEFTISATLVDEVVNGTEQATWIEDAPVAVVDGAYTTDVVNATGSLLPETGGMGTTMFYMIGAMMVAAAVVLLVSKKRMAFEA